MSVAIFSYLRFYRLRYKLVILSFPRRAIINLRSSFPSEFSYSWWKWLLSTGVFLALTISCKMNGVLTFLTIGTAVAIDMWNILDYRRGHDLVRVATCRNPGYS